MRFKWVPEPPDSIAAARTAQQAIPLVPASESDCLHRLVDRTDELGIDDQDDARQWLTFLRALGLVDQVASGYRRHQQEPTTGELVDRLLDRIYGARELYDLLAATDGPLSADELDSRAVDLPTWERHHHADHEQVRRRRVRRLAAWFVLCGMAERVSGGYLMSK